MPATGVSLRSYPRTYNWTYLTSHPFSTPNVVVAGYSPATQSVQIITATAQRADIGVTGYVPVADVAGGVVVQRANATVAGFDASYRVSGTPPVTNVGVIGYNGTGGLQQVAAAQRADVGATAYTPTSVLSGRAAQPNVAVTGLGVSGFDAGAPAGRANVTVAGRQPTESGTHRADRADVGVGALQPSAATDINPTPHKTTDVIVTGYIAGVGIVNFALPPKANVTVSGLRPYPTIRKAHPWMPVARGEVAGIDAGTARTPRHEHVQVHGHSVGNGRAPEVADVITSGQNAGISQSVEAVAVANVGGAAHQPIVSVRCIAPIDNQTRHYTAVQGYEPASHFSRLVIPPAVDVLVQGMSPEPATQVSGTADIADVVVDAESPSADMAAEAETADVVVSAYTTVRHNVQALFVPSPANVAVAAQAEAAIEIEAEAAEEITAAAYPLDPEMSANPVADVADVAVIGYNTNEHNVSVLFVPPPADVAVESHGYVAHITRCTTPPVTVRCIVPWGIGHITRCTTPPVPVRVRVPDKGPGDVRGAGVNTMWAFTTPGVAVVSVGANPQDVVLRMWIGEEGIDRVVEPATWPGGRLIKEQYLTSIP